MTEFINFDLINLFVFVCLVITTIGFGFTNNLFIKKTITQTEKQNNIDFRPIIVAKSEEVFFLNEKDNSIPFEILGTHMYDKFKTCSLVINVKNEGKFVAENVKHEFKIEGTDYDILNKGNVDGDIPPTSSVSIKLLANILPMKSFTIEFHLHWVYGNEKKGNVVVALFVNFDTKKVTITKNKYCLTE